MINFKHSMKLSHKLMIWVILAFMISAILFLALQAISNKALHKYCTTPDVISRQQQKKVSDLQRYIFDNKLSIADISQITQWAIENDSTLFSIYDNNFLIYDAKAPSFINNLESNIEVTPPPWQKLYPISFIDSKVTITIYDLFEHRYRDYLTYFNLMIFFLSFITIMLIFIKKQVSYITLLEKELKILESGNLNYSITIKNHDEISSLAQGIDNMRKAFIIREQYANEVKDASNQLMAAISHDLRTPLTTLIGYLDIVEVETSNKSSHTNHYLLKCRERAYQLKMLIDNLFQYFFVYTKSVEQIKLTSSSEAAELDKITQDYLFLLRQHGFQTIDKTTNDRYPIHINSNLIQRIFDNLLSNMLKYADPSAPTKIINFVENKAMVIEFRNKILQKPQLLESTGLGLKTCAKIMEQHQGQFFAQKIGTDFLIRLHFPIL